MALIERFKRDILKHRGRSAVLGTLFVILVALSIKAVFEMQIRPVNGSVVSTNASVPTAKTGETMPDSTTVAEAQERMTQSSMLWQSLQHVSPNAMSPETAFTFNASLYTPVAPVESQKNPTPVDAQPVKTAPAPAVDTEALKAARIREQARALVLKTTAVAPDTKPMAIVNQQLLTVGQEILGFEITAIRAREVEFNKDGITVVVKMPDGQ